MQPSNIKQATIGILCLVVYFFISFFSPYFLYAFGINYDALSFTIKALYNGSLNFLMIIGLIYVYRKEVKLSIKDLKTNHKIYFKKYFKYWFLILFVMYTMNILIMTLSGNEIAANEAGVREILKSAPLYAYISTVLFAPMLEEFLFRLSFRKIFTTKWIFIIISGLAFGSMHLIAGINAPIEILYIIPYGFPGAVFAYLLVKTDNILVPVAMHFLHNGLLTSLQVLLLFLL